MTLQTGTAREVVLTDPEQLKAMAHPVRTKILQVLEQRAASAKRLAEALDMTHGKIGHHLKRLEQAGLVEVVEERRVRALTERLYRASYDRLTVDLKAGTTIDPLKFLFRQAAREAAATSRQPFGDNGRIYAIRMPVDRARRFAERLGALADEFAAGGSDQGEVFGFAGAVYLADVPGEAEEGDR